LYLFSSVLFCCVPQAIGPCALLGIDSGGTQRIGSIVASKSIECRYAPLERSPLRHRLECCGRETTIATTQRRKRMRARPDGSDPMPMPMPNAIALPVATAMPSAIAAPLGQQKQRLFRPQSLPTAEALTGVSWPWCYAAGTNRRCRRRRWMKTKRLGRTEKKRCFVLCRERSGVMGVTTCAIDSLGIQHRREKLLCQ